MQTITLANLAEKSAQEVFEYIATHLLTQRKKCGRDDGGGFQCRYKYRALRCAAGALLGPNEYKRSYEGRSWEELQRYGSVPKAHCGLVSSLQDIHDEYEPDEWGRKLRELGAFRRLRIGFIRDLEK